MYSIYKRKPSQVVETTYGAALVPFRQTNQCHHTRSKLPDSENMQQRKQDEKKNKDDE